MNRNRIPVGRRAGLLTVASFLSVGFLFGQGWEAGADHESDTPCTDTDPINYSGSGVGEFYVANWPDDVLGRDGVRAKMNVYDPRAQGYKDRIVHSVYIYESADDLVETGWRQSKSAFAPPSVEGVVFAVKVFAGDYIVSGTSPLPFLNPDEDHTLKISRNPDGGAPSRFEFTIDQNQWGFFSQPNMQSGGAVVVGTENFDSCEDFRTHAWNMGKQLVPGGAWSNFGTPRVVTQDHTKWWGHEQAPGPEYSIKHCPNDPWCPDEL